MKIKVSNALQALRTELSGAADADAVADNFLAEAQRMAGRIRTSGAAITRWLAAAPAAPDGLFVDLDGRRQTQAHGLLQASHSGLLGEQWQTWAATACSESEEWDGPSKYDPAVDYWSERVEQINKTKSHMLRVWIDERDRFPVVAAAAA